MATLIRSLFGMLVMVMLVVGSLGQSPPVAASTLASNLVLRLPDLQVSRTREVDIPLFAVDISNTGSANAPAFTVHVYDYQNRLMASYGLTGLASGATRTIWFQPDSLCSTYRVVVDAQQQVWELRETNNSASFTSSCFG